jgi:hypothetical protein
MCTGIDREGFVEDFCFRVGGTTILGVPIGLAHSESKNINYAG